MRRNATVEAPRLEASDPASPGSRWTGVVEIAVVFGVGGAGVLVAEGLARDDPFLRQILVWFTNLLMLGLVWAGLRRRGEGWNALGLTLSVPRPGDVVRAVGLSVVVLIVTAGAFALTGAALAGFVEGAGSADVSGYEFLQGNLPLLLLSLAGVYVVSSFGEEVIYRGFLITRLNQTAGEGRRASLVALVVSSFVFGLAHYAWGWVGIVQTTAMGLSLGAFYLALDRRLSVLVLAHACADTLLLVPVYQAGTLGP